MVVADISEVPQIGHLSRLLIKFPPFTNLAGAGRHLGSSPHNLEFTRAVTAPFKLPRGLFFVAFEDCQLIKQASGWEGLDVLLHCMFSGRASLLEVSQ